MQQLKYNTGYSRYARVSQEDILVILEEYEACKAHTTVMDFCFDRKIPRSRFYNWRKLYSEKKDPFPKSRFIELSNPSFPVMPSPEKRLFASIHLNGMEVQLHEYVEASYLQNLLTQTSQS